MLHCNIVFLGEPPTQTYTLPTSTAENFEGPKEPNEVTMLTYHGSSFLTIF